MKLVINLLVIFTLLPAVAGHSADLSQKQQHSIAPELALRLVNDPEGIEYDVLVRLTAPDESSARLSNLAASAVNLRDRYQRIGASLRASASLGIPSVPGRASVVRRFWIANVVEMRVDRAALLGLAESDDVVMVAPNVGIELLHPVSIADAVSANAAAAPNLQTIGARALWMRGLTGKGRLVASIDTGVEGYHPALADRWHGKHGDTAASWFDPLNGPSPVDNSGHGTHVMGIMVGRDGADTIGLAPDAEWICAAVVDRGRSLSATFADILAALQWVVDPDGNPQTMDDVPDVVCNSWGVSQQIINPCDQLFFEAIDNVEAMGVVCVFAAGNEGPSSMSIRNPADRATSPTASFSVGAVDANTFDFSVPSFSSRGPSACDGLAKKPEIAAPGVSIRSAYKGQTYKLISGTSMAAPHVAAAVALLRQYNPELTPEQIKTALLSTARDIGALGEDNASGKGMIDLEAAVASLTSPIYPLVTTGEVLLDSKGDGVLALGEIVELVVSMTGNVVDANNVTLHLSSLSLEASILTGSAYLGTVPAGGATSNADAPFVVYVSDYARAGDTARFEVRISGDPMLAWWRDTVAVMVGLPAGTELATYTEGLSALTVSNFGHFGLADGSSLSAGGAGWRTSTINANILYEGALIVASSDGGWSDASLRQDGSRRFDFAPQMAAADGILCFDDSRSENPVGLAIDQTASPTFRSGSYDVTTIIWNVRNVRAASIKGVQLGWMIDIDLPGVGAIDETVALDPASDGYFHAASGSDLVAGLAPLSGGFGALNVFQYAGSKQPLSTVEKRQSMQGRREAPNNPGDYFAIAATNPVDLAAGDSIVIAVAFISANNDGSFAAAAGEARSRWLTISDVNDGLGGVRPPSDYRLDQNYPNPFNAGTTIPIQIAGDGSRTARLDVFDLLGLRVRTLLNETVAAGHYHVLWDGRDDDGRPVASGVYFARLVVAGQGQQVRSMVLLK